MCFNKTATDGIQASGRNGKKATSSVLGCLLIGRSCAYYCTRSRLGFFTCKLGGSDRRGNTTRLCMGVSNDNRDVE